MGHGAGLATYGKYSMGPGVGLRGNFYQKQFMLRSSSLFIVHTVPKESLHKNRDCPGWIRCNGNCLVCKYVSQGIGHIQLYMCIYRGIRAPAVTGSDFL